MVLPDSVASRDLYIFNFTDSLFRSRLHAWKKMNPLSNGAQTLHNLMPNNIIAFVFVILTVFLGGK